MYRLPARDSWRRRGGSGQGLNCTVILTYFLCITGTVVSSIYGLCVLFRFQGMWLLRGFRVNKVPTNKVTYHHFPEIPLHLSRPRRIDKLVGSRDESTSHHTAQFSTTEPFVPDERAAVAARGKQETSDEGSRPLGRQQSSQWHRLPSPREPTSLPPRCHLSYTTHRTAVLCALASSFLCHVEQTERAGATGARSTATCTYLPTSRID
ncbi:hypothetical protein F4823DRAFT_384706 [Ustulina deusta]|nr:hypothetical protein F4823DRAFT_384706 [Ustulina deusta]